MEPITRFTAKMGDYFGLRISNLIKSASPSKGRRFLFTIGKYLLYQCGNIVRPFQKFLVKDDICHTFGSMNYLKSRKSKDIFPLTTISFEDMTTYVPGNYDAYLTRMFGNYNKIPQINSADFHIHRAN